MTKKPATTNNQDTKGLAIASMVCGIIGLLTWWSLWFGFAISLVGAIIGIVCLSKHDKKDDSKGFAIAGIVSGALGAFLSGLFLSLVMFFGVAVSDSINNGSIDQIIQNIESDPTNIDVDPLAE